ncbi:MAG: VOC family protein [Pleurocapsa sp. MO_192.B19]|nr:VOC family protein [Pleurocapsa sp. MO_192.B19]
MNKHEKINYVEFPAKDIEATKAFFAQVFGWTFEDYGTEYTAFSNAGIDGGFFQSDLTASTENGSALVVFYSQELEQTQSKIENAGGLIVKPIFSFPGGRRFHFSDPNGNEYAVWSEINASPSTGKKIITH